VDLLLARYGEPLNTLYRNSDGTARMYDYRGRLPGGDRTDVVFVVGDWNDDGAPDLFLSEDGAPGRLLLGDPARRPPSSPPPDGGLPDAASPDGGAPSS